MVLIASKHFNNDLDDYLTHRRTKEHKYQRELEKRLKEKSQGPEDIPEALAEDEFQDYEEKRPWYGELFSGVLRKRIPADAMDAEAAHAAAPARRSRKDGTMSKQELPVGEDEGFVEEQEIVEDDDAQEEERPRKEGAMKRLLKKISAIAPKRAREEEEVEPQTDEEVREVLKLLHKWIEKLPPSEIRAFKSSPDFERYKALLEKYGLIKKPGQ